MGLKESVGWKVRASLRSRGGILDIYNLADECPYRVELWGDEIDSIRSFDVESQRSIEQVDEVTIDPAAEYIMSVSVRDRGLKLIDQDMKQQVQRLKDAGNYEAAARLKQAVAELKDNLELSAALQVSIVLCSIFMTIQFHFWIISRKRIV